MAPAVRQADDSWQDGVSHFYWHRECTGFRLNMCSVSVGETPCHRVIGMDQQRASRLSLHEAMRVVHPGVVAAKLPSSDQLQLTIGVAVVARNEPLACLAHEVDWCKIDRAASPGDDLCDPARFERPEIPAVRRSSQLCEAESMRRATARAGP